MFYFDDLGQRLEHVWRQRNYDDDVFPDLACDMLRAHPPPPHVTPASITSWIFARASLPRQVSLDESFGQPPLTVFWGRRFFIDVYFWVDGTTAIHQHGFGGAFHVLAGSSIHGRYTFRETRRFSDRLLFGELDLVSMDLLAAGATVPIQPFQPLIHSLFHLDRPAVTIVVRTVGHATNPPPYVYRRPGMAIAPFDDDVYLTKALQLVAMLHRTELPERDELLWELLARCDLFSAYRVLHRCLELRALNVAALTSLLQVTAGVHGSDVANRLTDVLKEEARDLALVRLRERLHGADHRFLLGILRNAPGRQTALRLVAQQYPDEDPVALVARLVSEMSTERRLGIDVDEPMLAHLRARLAGDGSAADEATPLATLLAPLLRDG